MNVERRAADVAKGGIELVVPSLIAAGMELLVARIALALSQRGHLVGVSCLFELGPGADALTSSGVDVGLAPTPGKATLLRAPALIARLRKRKPHVVHVHGNAGHWLKTIHAAAAARVGRTVYTLHGLEPPQKWFEPWLMRLAALQTDEIIVVADPLREYLESRVGIREGRVRLVLNGVDTNQFKPAQRKGALRRTLNIPEDHAIVATVGRLVPVKDHKLLLTAFASLLKLRPKTTLVIIGEGPLREELELTAAGLGIERNVRMPGVMNDLSAIYPDFELFVLSSRSEGTSMSALEAMSSGVCVLATAVGGTPALLDHGRTGHLVPPEDADALAMSAAALLDDAARRQALGTRARERACTEYGFDRMVDDYEALYQLPDRPAPGSRTPDRLAPCAE